MYFHRCRTVARVNERDLNPLVANRRFQLIGGALRHHPSIVDHRGAVGELVGLFEVLGGQQDSRSLRDLGFKDQAGDDVRHSQPIARIETRGRFVKEERLRACRRCAGQVDAPSHPAAEALHRPVFGFLKVEKRDELLCLHSHLHLCGTQMVEAPHHDEVFEVGEILVDGNLLSRYPNDRADSFRTGEHVYPGDPSTDRRGLGECREHFHVCGLARPIRPEQHNDNALRNFKIETVERVQGTGRLRNRQAKFRSADPWNAVCRPSRKFSGATSPDPIPAVSVS